MRRSLVVFVSVFMLAALVPSAALAGKPSFTIASITVKNVTTSSSGTCMVSAQVTWTAANQIRAVRFTQDSGTGTEEHVVTVGRGSTTLVQYFYGVDLDAFNFRWGAQLLGGGDKELDVEWTGYESWTDSSACPAALAIIASYPTT